MFNKIPLPTSVEQFDVLIDRLCKKYKLKDKHHAAAIVGVAIRHLPNDQAFTTYSYLGQSVLKNIANYVANYKCETLKHESQITQLLNLIQEDPNNQQAMDELQKAADQGSEKAKAALEKLTPIEVKDNVEPIRPI